MIYKSVNLQSLSDTSNIFHQSYPQNLELLKKTKGYNLKNVEVEGLKKLIEELKKAGSTAVSLSDFYSSYNIPQINKEFDLLRFGLNYNINIELKSNKDEKSILKQLQKNKYYLKHLEKDTIFITYLSGKNIFYKLHENSLNQIQPKDVASYISKQIIKNVSDINSLFNVKNFLICPISSNNLDFIHGNYFLTPYQTELKNKIIKSQLADKFFKVEGKPGTGKTLLCYDIAKDYINSGKKVIIFHSGLLNDGHEKLNAEKGWDIRPAKKASSLFAEANEPDLVIIDEAQRIYSQQFKEIDEYIESSNKTKLVISYDPRQTLSKKEQDHSLVNLIYNEDKILEKYTSIVLSKKIRTNPSVANFIQGLFNLPDMNNAHDFNKISVEYFTNFEDCKDYVQNIENLNKDTTENWTTFNYTTSSINYEPLHEQYLSNKLTAHQIIGQEFENVIAILDNNFTYNENNQLIYTSRTYYDPEKMLYQMVTRTVNKLKIIVVNNPHLYYRILEAINKSSEK